MKESFLHPDLEMFARLVPFDSFSQAALSLGIHQPALSKLVSRLEQQTGKKLLIRGRTGFGLTHDGEELMARVRQLLAAWKESERVRGVPASLHIACHDSLAITHFPTLLPRLMKTFPGVDVQVSMAPSVEVSRRVAEGEWDLGLVINPLRHRDLLFRHVGEEFLGVWGKGAKRGEVVLAHPDMLQVGRWLRQLTNVRTMPMPSYETIASILKVEERWSGLLPSPVAGRHGLRLQGDKFFHTKLHLIARKDKLPGEFFRKTAELLKT